MNAEPYAPVRRCIYCGATSYNNDGKPLHEEHIVPAGLGGRPTLPEASCRRCEQITGHFEQLWLRGTLRAARSHLDLQTRRKKEKLDTISIRDTSVRPERRVVIDIDDHPSILFLPLFDAPRLFNPKPLPTDFEGTWLNELNDKSRIIEEKYGASEFALASTNVFAMGRSLAKIAHAYTVAVLGLDGFRPILPSYICGTDDAAMNYYVGGSLGVDANTTGNYEIGLELPTAEQWEFVVVHIRLFAKYHGPTYRIVSGYRLKPIKPLDIVLAEVGALPGLGRTEFQYRALLPMPVRSVESRAACSQTRGQRSSAIYSTEIVAT